MLSDGTLRRNVSSSFWCCLPSLFEPVLLLKTIILLLLLQLIMEFILYEQPFPISSSDDAGHVHRSMIHSQRSLMEVGWKNICLIIEWLLCCVLIAWQGAEWLLVAGQEMLAALI